MSELPDWLRKQARVQTVVPSCCVIGCGNPAEFGIHGGSGHFEDATEACENHVGTLLGTPDWLEPDNKQWTVAALGDTEDE